MPGVTPAQFAALNGLFLLFGLGVVMSGRIFLLLLLAGLFLANTVIHLIPTLMGNFAPGVFSKLLLYLPLSLYAYIVLLNRGTVSSRQALCALAGGILLMAVPFGFQRLRQLLANAP